MILQQLNIKTNIAANMYVQSGEQLFLFYI